MLSSWGLSFKVLTVYGRHVREHINTHTHTHTHGDTIECVRCFHKGLGKLCEYWRKRNHLTLPGGKRKFPLVYGIKIRNRLSGNEKQESNQIEKVLHISEVRKADGP